MAYRLKTFAGGIWSWIWKGGGGAVGKGVVRDGGWGESYTGRDGDDCPTCTFWGVKIPG